MTSLNSKQTVTPLHGEFPTIFSPSTSQPPLPPDSESAYSESADRAITSDRLLGERTRVAVEVFQLHAQLLQRASEILGGTEKLESFLNVSETRLRIWERGIAPLPDDVFLKLVDVVLTGSSARAGPKRLSP